MTPEEIDDEVDEASAQEVRRWLTEKLCAEALRRLPEPPNISTLQMRRLAAEVVHDELRDYEEAPHFIPVVYRCLLDRAEKALRPAGFWTEAVPLLTKVFQWTSGVDEVAWLFYSFPARYREALINAAAHASNPSPTLFPELQRLPEQEQVLTDMVTICKLAQSAMQTIYEQGGVLPRVLVELNDYLKSTNVVRLVYDPSVYHDSIGPFPLNAPADYEAGSFSARTDISPFPLNNAASLEGEAEEADFDDLQTRQRKRAAILEKGLWPVSGIVEQTEELMEVSAAGVIARELKRVIIDDSRLLARCIECQSIFERNRNRPGQRFCSFRCADRNGQRRRKQKKQRESTEEEGIAMTK